MKSLGEITEVVVNNDECVVLKVKADSEMDLIALAHFSGDEIMFRLTKGDVQNCTVFYKNGRHFSWHWGIGGFTCVSDSTKKEGKLIQSTIEQHFGIDLKRPKGWWNIND